MVPRIVSPSRDILNIKFGFIRTHSQENDQYWSVIFKKTNCWEIYGWLIAVSFCIITFLFLIISKHLFLNIRHVFCLLWHAECPVQGALPTIIKLENFAMKRYLCTEYVISWFNKKHERHLTLLYWSSQACIEFHVF